MTLCSRHVTQPALAYDVFSVLTHLSLMTFGKIVEEKTIA